ncbi:MAG TPA: polysaccharide biosynthesis protein [Negativicutes bacterium]|nr:polysaccharide biosynthesis protein [Negativicutes bacterium]
MSKEKFLKGALILTVAGIVVKVIGSVNRIFLSRLLGGEGIGLYQMAYPIYLLALSISSAGIPVAISILVAEKAALQDYRGANRVFRISLSLLIVTGFLFSILLYFGAGWLIEHQYVRDPRAYYAIAALAPAIFFVTILSSYRGYFQGMQMMLPTGISQIAEQLVRVITMVGFAYFLLPRGLEYAAAGASFGAGPGAVTGLLVLLFFYWKYRKDRNYQMEHQPQLQQESGTSIIVRIVKLALPVSLANIMLPIVSNIDLLIVPPRLEVAGYTVEQATELFGYLTGMAVPLVNMATILTASLAASIVPSVSEANTLGDREAIYDRTSTALRIANLITIPAFVGMWLLATPISTMLYATPKAGVCIAISALGIFLLGIHQVTTGVLQGLGRTAVPVMNMVISAGIKVVLSWTFTAMPSVGIVGAAWATIADFGFAALLNMFFIYRSIGFVLDVKDTLKTATAAAVMGIVSLGVYTLLFAQGIGNTLSTLTAILIGGGVYAVLLLMVGSIGERELLKIPAVGRQAVDFLNKIHLLRR